MLSTNLSKSKMETENNSSTIAGLVFMMECLLFPEPMNPFRYLEPRHSKSADETTS